MRIKTCLKCGAVSVPAQSFCPGCGSKLPETTQVDSAVRCPSCLSTQIAANQKGFGAGKAAVGAVLLGPAGLLAGLVQRRHQTYVLKVRTQLSTTNLVALTKTHDKKDSETICKERVVANGRDSRCR